MQFKEIIFEERCVGLAYKTAFILYISITECQNYIVYFISHVTKLNVFLQQNLFL